MGYRWTVINHYVKAFFWSSTPTLVVERMEPSGSNSVWELDLAYLPFYQMFKNRPKMRMLNESFTVIIVNVEDFQIRGDYKFATSKDTKVGSMHS